MAELISPAAVAYSLQRTTARTGQLGEAAAWTEGNTVSPEMMSGLAEMRLLEALIAISGAREVLEIGTFTGVGTLTMAAALPADGRVTTLEVDPETAATARRHFGANPFGGRIKLIEGSALDTLNDLSGPFDLVYIDAWKNDYPAYYDLVVPRLAPRGMIVADNLFRDGMTLDPEVADDGTEAMREFARIAHEDDRVDNVLLTIGDGVMLIWPRPGVD